ncbi:hypothetical protein [Pseudoduganella aquatica]|uniref:Uncharacterized protein n=1 Tax=Pseudoduganella aquatica TaxID=2660641 RepID=A0A7X4HGT5_9BURK|nr:hypothetical protein [Pseudoduganella aquatica]MYN10172.1 hypothetical protein [Pseudoduganella aquatica]
MDECDAHNYAGPTLVCTVSGDGYRVHRLVDDQPYRFKDSKCQVRRDPMVAALFGAAGSTAKKGKKLYS